MTPDNEGDREGLDDWLDEDPIEPWPGERRQGEGPHSDASAGGFLSPDPTDRDPGDLEAASREERRRQREERRSERGGEGEAGLGEIGARIGASIRGIFSRGSRDGDSAPGVDHGSLGGGRHERHGRGAGSDGSDTYRRRRLIAGGAILGAVALIVLAVIVVGAISSDDPQPEVVATPTMDVTIPEGLTREQTADLAKESGVRGNYKAASKKAEGFNLKKYGAQGADNLEGFLFPATYNLEERASAEDLVTRQLETFEDRISQVDLKFAESKNLNEYDILKIASMIEREIMVPKERRLAAAVIYNRLSAGIPLGIDSTIRYEDGNFDKQLTAERLNRDTPYNTRTRPGLPPTPIGNPGLAAIEAAANPKRSDVLFFVVKPGTCGEHVFTASQEEFDQAAAEYQRALEREGGSPTDCPEE